jgi:hypothetical protein
MILCQRGFILEIFFDNFYETFCVLFSDNNHVLFIVEFGYAFPSDVGFGLLSFVVDWVAENGAVLRGEQIISVFLEFMIIFEWVLTEFFVDILILFYQRIILGLNQFACIKVFHFDEVPGPWKFSRTPDWAQPLN